MNEPTTPGHRSVSDETPKWFLTGINRREFIIGAAALGSLLVACSSDESGGTASSSSGPSDAGPWTFTDARGETITLPAKPARVVAQVSAARPLLEAGVDVVGIFSSAPLEDSPELDGVDITGIETLGEVWGEVNLEKLAAVAPDIVAVTYNSTGDELVGLNNTAKQNAGIEAFAPIVGVRADETKAAFESFASLEESLGVDLNNPTIKASRERFEQASEALAAATAAKPGLSVLPIQGQPDVVYALNPVGFPELGYFESLGLEILVPKGAGDYVKELSWETIGEYPADVLLVDNRAFALTPQDMEEFPTYRDYPAVEAGQVGGWTAASPMSYELYADNLEAVTALVERSSADVVA